MISKEFDVGGCFYPSDWYCMSCCCFGVDVVESVCVDVLEDLTSHHNVVS